MKIKLLNKTVFETFDHYVMELDVDSFCSIKNALTMIKIEKDHLEDAGTAIGNTTRKWIVEDYPYAEGYRFLNENGDQVGSCWMMLKGGDEKLYKVRYCDCFIFRLQVDETYRGQGYSKMIMSNMIGVMKQRGFATMRLVVATKNQKALNLYRSLGMKDISRKIFVRMFDRNIPYYTV